MRKDSLLWLIVGIFLVSCSKKTHPATSVLRGNPDSKYSIPKSETKIDTPANGGIDIPTAPAATTMLAPMIVIDEKGEIITSRNKLPDNIAAKVDYKKISRSFTPVQRKNLIYRFKMVPPRVLFVPDNLASKTARGYYCVYKKKFWYWKKEDGLFYLDDTYYQ